LCRFRWCTDHEDDVTTSRTEIADHLADAFDGGAATKHDLICAAQDRGASHAVVVVLHTLPEGRYRELRSLWPHLPQLPIEA
jgi:hypothetical protein